LDFQIAAKKGLHFEKVRRTGGHSLRSSCGFEFHGHSGRGRIFKGDGVVGIARAFLAAGAPSSKAVLVSLWEIDDEATMMFMKSFYQHLKKEDTASGALHQSMKSLRESEECSGMRCWAPYQLIGDNVKIEFEGLMTSKNESSNKKFFFSFNLSAR